MTRPNIATSWVYRLLELAEHIAQWSKDPSTKVGAVIVDDQRVVLGVGYNGFPRGVRDTEERLVDRPTKHRLVVHAEANAILNARTSLRGAALVATKHPCSECAKLIVQSGIREVYAPPLDESGLWAEDGRFARLILSEGGVRVGLLHQGYLRFDEVPQ